MSEVVLRICYAFAFLPMLFAPRTAVIYSFSGAFGIYGAKGAKCGYGRSSLG
jgi:hypothetical protein